MADLNIYSATGRLGADAEVKYTASGTAVWKCRIAVGYGFGDRAGTNWVSVAAFGKRAEGLAKLGLCKGDRIGIAGELHVREYDRRDGTKGTSVEVAAWQVEPLGGRRSGSRPTPQAVPGAVGGQGAGFQDDDLGSIPF